MTPFGHDPSGRGPVRGRVDRNFERTVTQSPCHTAVTRCLRLAVCRRLRRWSCNFRGRGAHSSHTVSATTPVRCGRQEVVPTTRQTHLHGVSGETLRAGVCFVKLACRGNALSRLGQPRSEQIRHVAEFVLTAQGTRRTSLHSVVSSREHQIVARVAGVVAWNVTRMYARKIRAAHHSKVDRCVTGRTRSFGHGPHRSWLRRGLRSPPRIETSADLRLAEHSLVEAKLHQKVHRLADDRSRLHAEMLHHCHTIHLRA